MPCPAIAGVWRIHGPARPALVIPSGLEWSALLNPRRIAAALGLVGGAILVLVGIVRLVFREVSRSRARRAGELPRGVEWRSWLVGADFSGTPGGERTRGGGTVGALLALVVLAGGWLRVFEIEVKTLTHTEAMLPNIPWPPDSWPPARHSFYETFWWHFHSELHPPAHYLLMWGWIEMFGTSLTSLRLPSALFGIASILVCYRIGVLVHDHRVGLLAATLVAFNGFHIFISQYARVYMMGTFLALLSTLALLRVLGRAERRRGAWAVIYVAASCLAIHTQTFFWIVLAVQMGWVAIQTSPPPRFIRRVLAMQALVVMVGAPAVVHQIYLSVPGGYPAPSLGFVVDYLLLGFAFLPDVLSIPPRRLSGPVYAAAAVFAISLVVLGVLRGLRPGAKGTPADPVCRDEGPDHGRLPGIDGWRGPLRTVAAGGVLVTLGFAILAHRRSPGMAAALALPLLSLGLPVLYGRARAVIGRGPWGRTGRPLAVRLGRPATLISLLAFVPTAGLLVFALHFSILNPRAFQIFAVYVPIVAAAGLGMLVRRRLIAVPVLIATVLVHVGSVQHWRGHPSESRDYRALAERMNERMEPGDFLFIVPEEPAVTPLYYYLADRGYNHVTRDYAQAVRGKPGARVWLVFVESYEWGPFMTTTEEMMAALEDFRLEEEIEALRAGARLFVRDPDA